MNDGSRTIGLSGTENQQLQSFGFKVPQRFVTVDSRVLAPPRIGYLDSKKKVATSEKDYKYLNTSGGSWNMKDIKMLRGATISEWIVIWIKRTDRSSDPQAHTETELQKNLAAFRKVLVDSGLHINAHKAILRVTVSSYDDPQLDAAFKSASSATKPGGNTLIVVLVPDSDAPLYRNVKMLGDTKFGIRTQVLVDGKFADQVRTKRGGLDYMANVGLKINIKFGGVNQSVPDLGIINQGATMVIGLDVTHPSPNSSREAPSIVAIVASRDKTCSQFPGETLIQAGRQEKVEAVGDLLKTRIKLWRDTNDDKFPRLILVYRDGVSEGQYPMVLEHELAQMKKACKEVYPPQATATGFPKFTILVVGKRHHTRFAVPNLNDGDFKTSNPKNGTVVDRGITEAANWDFFLQAHHGLQGTARPAHYFCVVDEIFRSTYAPNGTTPLPAGFKNIADVVEDLTHRLCYSFARATKAVSICPPAYYADILAERARGYKGNVFDVRSPAGSVAGSGGGGMGGAGIVSQGDISVHPNLKDTMYYM